MSLSDDLLERLRSVSSRLVVTQHKAVSADEVPSDLWGQVDILYTLSAIPDRALAPRLHWVQLHSAGVNHLLDSWLWESDLPVTTTSGIHAPNIAEYVMLMLLAFAHRLPGMLHHQARAEWPKGRWDKFVPRELRGATLGVIGYGHIGREIGRLAHAFGMRVLAVRRGTSAQPLAYQLPELAGAATVPATEGSVPVLPARPGVRARAVAGPRGIVPGARRGARRGRGAAGAGRIGTGSAEPDRLLTPEHMLDVLAEADYVVLTAPYTSATHHLIDQKALRAMQPSAVLVNVARGALVDEAALVRALREGWIAGAVLDVFEQEPLPADSLLWGMENVIISPHVAGFTPHYDRRAADLFAENLRRYLSGQPLLNQVEREREY
jgi:phosphoglycerate dehydrogenase-like enzyme